MSPQVQNILEEVAKRIVPSESERDKMARLAEKLKNQVRNILENSGLEGNVSVQGSFARDTWLRGEADLDIFAAFPPSMDRHEWTNKVLPSIKKGIKAKAVDRYAEHPFLEFEMEGIRVNIVPCYAVEKGQWKSATDRTPFHTDYMQDHLTHEMRLQARLLKRFLKGIRSYGAEIRVGGLSGMLVETLILNYKTFLKTLESVAEWKPIIFLDLENSVTSKDSRPQKFGAPLVVVDPVDPDRNLAAAVRHDKLWSFVAASRELLENPGLWYFFPSKLKPTTRTKFNKTIESLDRDIAAVAFRHTRIVPDVLWGQLLKMEKGLTDLMARQDFRPLKSVIWSDEKESSVILVELESSTLSPTHVRQGPPISKRKDGKGFLDHHLKSKDTIRGPWIENDRWVVEKKREVTDVTQLVSSALRNPKLGLSVPDSLNTPGGNLRVLVNGKILSLIGREGFDQVLSEFLAAKPGWLKSHH